MYIGVPVSNEVPLVEIHSNQVRAQAHNIVNCAGVYSYGMHKPLVWCVICSFTHKTMQAIGTHSLHMKLESQVICIATATQ